MRISTGMIFDAGVNAIQRQTSSLLHTQQQVSSGQRMLTPADDPVAAAQALDVTQTQSINSQYITNQKAAGESLGLEDSTLSSVGNLLTQIKQLAVQAGGGALTDADRRSIGGQLRGIYSELLGLANTTDSSGQYMFAGYESSSQPFSGSVDTGVTYSGDSGQRLMQVSSTRQIAVSDPGDSVFMNVPSGNGYFSTAANAANTGTAVIDGGSVTDPAKWNSAGNDKNFTVKFAVDSTVVPPSTTYDIIDNVTGNSLLTGGAPGGAPYPRTYASGQDISLSQTSAPAFDYGASIIINGQPANGDSFTIQASGSQSVFQTVSDLITAVESPSTGASANTLLANSIGSALTNLNQDQNNLLSVRASVGARMNELDSLTSLGTSLDTQYAATLSRLQDTDYASAISKLTQEQTSLQAAQQSFTKVSGLSLFKYL